jgi:TatA/E family protein of Tat protein translocase
MFNIGPLELMVILLLALVVVGPSKLPEVGRSIGRALREFRNIQDEMRDTINFNLDEPARPRPAPRPRTARTPEQSASSPKTDDLDREPGAAAGSLTESAPSGGDEPPSTEARRGEHSPSDAAEPPPPPGSPNGSSPAPETPRE